MRNNVALITFCAAVVVLLSSLSFLGREKSSSIGITESLDSSQTSSVPPLQSDEGSIQRIRPIPLLSVSLTTDSKQYLPRLLSSIDYPVSRINILIGNSDANIRESVMQSIKNASSHVSNLEITTMLAQGNPGSAGGLNFGLVGLRNHTNDPSAWVLATTSDVAFYPGVLKNISNQMEDNIKQNNNFGIGFTSLCCGSEWSAVMFTRRIIDRIGYFDENFYPAYYEDEDYAIRVHLSGMHAVRFEGTPLMHGDLDGSIDHLKDGRTSSYVRENDAAILKENSRYRDGLLQSKKYLLKKWGVDIDTKRFSCRSVQSMNKRCPVTYRFPFNDPDNSLSFWKHGGTRRYRIL